MAIEVQVKAIDGYTHHSTHDNWKDAVDQADMVHGRIVVADPEDTLQFLEWSNNEDNPGYSCWNYFDAEGNYLGADQYGIEPVFA